MRWRTDAACAVCSDQLGVDHDVGELLGHRLRLPAQHLSAFEASPINASTSVGRR